VAIFHFSAKVVSRGAGQSVVAAAAYQSRSDLYNERDGQTKSYSSHGQQELLESAIYAPKDSPEWVFSREQLWNAAEKAEDQHNKTRAKSAITARHIELALPHELTLEQNKRLVVDFVRDNFTRKGFVADINIHSADRDGDSRNIHAHILVTMRKLDGQELSAIKDRNNRKELRELLNHWRENWAKQQSRHLERAGFKMEAARMVYGHKTLEEQAQIAEVRQDFDHAEALRREPTIHEGANATQMKREGRGDESRLATFNQQAMNRREAIEKARAERESIKATEERIIYANTPQGHLSRVERAHEWQRDRLALNQERERLKQQDAHTWQRRDDLHAVPDVVRSHERERARELDSLERKQAEERQTLEQRQRDERDRAAADKIWHDHAGDILGMQSDIERNQYRQGKKTRIRNMDKSAAQKEAERKQSDYYSRIKRDQKAPTEEQQLNRDLQAELRRQQREAEKAAQKPAWHEAHREEQDQQSREKVQQAQTAREAQLARIMKRRKQGLQNELENDGGRELEL